MQNGLSTLNKKTAFKVLTSDSVVSSVNGAAGTGKSYVLGAVNEVYQQNGYAVYGVALQSKTADNMQQDIGVKSSTISRFLMGIENGNIRLDHKSVIILDEAGMVGSRDMLALLSAVESNHAKIRMVGDSFQLTAVSAGNAFAKVQEHLSNDYQASLSQSCAKNPQKCEKLVLHYPNMMLNPAWIFIGIWINSTDMKCNNLLLAIWLLIGIKLKNHYQKSCWPIPIKT